MVAPNLRIRKWLLVSVLFGPNLQLSFLWRKLLKLAPPRMLAHWHEACSILKLESLIGTVFAAFSCRILLVFCITLIFTCVCAIVAAHCQETTKANEPVTKARKPRSLEDKSQKSNEAKKHKSQETRPCLRFFNVGPGVEALVDFLPYLFGGLEVLLVRPRWARAQPALQRFLVQQLWPCVIRMSGAVNLAGLLWCHGLGSFWLRTLLWSAPTRFWWFCRWGLSYFL